MRVQLFWLLLFAVPLLSQSSENRGIVMTIRRTFAGNSSDEKVYLQADRKRMETRNALGQRKPNGATEWLVGPRIAMITRCDFGQIFDLNLDAGEYQSAPYPPKPWTKEEMKARGLTRPDVSQRVAKTLRIDTTKVDTGERKEFFGHTARHVVTTRKEIPLEGSHAEPQETVTDGWYIDLRPEVSCTQRVSSGKVAHGYLTLASTFAERPDFVDIGKQETGFGVQLVTSSKGFYKLPDGSCKSFESTTETQVTELRQEPLDPALFEIPAGFKHVAHIETNPQEAQSSSWLNELWARVKNFFE